MIEGDQEQANKKERYKWVTKTRIICYGTTFLMIEYENQKDLMKKQEGWTLVALSGWT